MGNGVVTKCDARELLEDAGITEGAAITAVVFQCFVVIFNVLGFIGLWNCIPWMIGITVITCFANLVWCMVYWIMSYQYWYLFWIIWPLALCCFFTNIYNSAMYHVNEARRNERSHPLQP